MVDFSCWFKNRLKKKFAFTLSQKGVALIMVLLVLILLTVVVAEFCFTTRMEANITWNFKEGEKAYYCARAGLYKAILELVKAKSKVKKAEAAKTTLVEREMAEEEEWRPRDAPYHFSLGDSECEIFISDEGGKININAADQNLLRRLVEEGCGIQGSERDTIVDSILDWRDADKEHRLNGAEDDYYMSLPEPYHCRNGNFVVTEELLLVKGITEEIFYGSGKKGYPAFTEEVRDEDQQGKLRMRTGKGLSELVTVYSDSKQININSAPFEILMLLPGMTPETAAMIMELRAEKELKIGDPRLANIPNYQQIAPFITFVSSPYYQIVVIGKIQESPLKKILKAVVRIGQGERDRYEVVYFREGL